MDVLKKIGLRDRYDKIMEVYDDTFMRRSEIVENALKLDDPLLSGFIIGTEIYNSGEELSAIIIDAADKLVPIKGKIESPVFKEYPYTFTHADGNFLKATGIEIKRFAPYLANALRFMYKNEIKEGSQAAVASRNMPPAAQRCIGTYVAIKGLTSNVFIVSPNFIFN